MFRSKKSGSQFAKRIFVPTFIRTYKRVYFWDIRHFQITWQTRIYIGIIEMNGLYCKWEKKERTHIEKAKKGETRWTRGRIKKHIAIIFVFNFNLNLIPMLFHIFFPFKTSSTDFFFAASFCIFISLDFKIAYRKKCFNSFFIHCRFCLSHPLHLSIRFFYSSSWLDISQTRWKKAAKK